MFYNTKQLRNILYIEDDEGLARLLQRRMERFGYVVDISATGEEGVEKFKSEHYDIILIDNYLPGMSGIDILKELSNSNIETPAIFLTASGDEKLAIEALRNNAADYLVKDAGQTYLELLPSVMAAAHTRVELLKQNKLQEETLRAYAEKLIYSQQRLNAALEGTNTGVWDWDITTGELYWSDNLKDAYGMAPEEKPTIEFWMQMVHPEDREHVKAAMRDHINGKRKHYYCIFREKAPASSGREWNWVLARGLAQRDETGKAYRITGTSSDFTVHKQLEEQLEQEKEKAERANRSKSEFLATMSHEIRTPMNAIIGLADVLTRTELDEKQTKILETMRSSSETLMTLINDLLDISRIEANQVELEHLPFNLNDLILEISGLLAVNADAKKLKLKTDCSELENINFFGDKHRIKQIITNLCSNAIKFTDKGNVTISGRCSKFKDDVYHIVIKVSDTGIGIAKEKLATIFDKFVQADQSISRRFGGSGLGLAISQSLALQMGGHISVESVEKEGSKFALFLPLQIARDVKPASKDNKLESQMTEAPKHLDNLRKILLVEDHEPNVMVAGFILENMGYEYDVASNGHQAVEMVTKAPNIYNVILMDVQMHGMDGLQATQEIRRLEKVNGWEPHKVIGLTAHALAGDRERCIDAGMNDYTTKPINPAELENKINSLAA